MSREYSIYDAKAKLSSLVRQVREGQSFVITVHGEAVAELRPIERSESPRTLAQRIADLEAQGVITPAVRLMADNTTYPRGKKKAGALLRFLEDRE